MLFKRFNNIFYTNEDQLFFVYVFGEDHDPIRIPDKEKSFQGLIEDTFYLNQGYQKEKIIEKGYYRQDDRVRRPKVMLRFNPKSDTDKTMCLTEVNLATRLDY